MKNLRVIVFSIFFVTACTPSGSNTLTIPASTPTTIANPTATVSPINTIAASITPEEFQIEETRSAVLELLKSNKGCKLPCFLGITPGQTSWNEAHEFLKTFSVQHSNPSGEEDFFYSNYYLPAIDIYGDYDLNLELAVLNGIVYGISVHDFDIPSFQLNNFLLANGKPDEIWVFTNNSSPSGNDNVGFLVSLYYKNQQMLANFGRGQAIIDSEWLNGCIMHSPSLRIWAWDESLNFPETTFNDLDVIQYSWKTISEATQGKIDTDKFYSSFSNPDTEPCFQTPRNIWTEP